MEILGGLLGFIGLAGLVVGAIALAKGSLQWASIPTRTAAAGVLAASFAVTVGGGALIPDDEAKVKTVGGEIESTTTSSFSSSTIGPSTSTTVAPATTTTSAPARTSTTAGPTTTTQRATTTTTRTTATTQPPTTTTTRPATTTTQPTTVTTRTSNCDSHYPGVCIPPAPPDLDCPQVPYTNFAVLPGDPHGFDSDKDGIGCEKN